MFLAPCLAVIAKAGMMGQFKAETLMSLALYELDV